MAWLPQSYAWGNFTMLAIGVWAIAQRDSIDAVLMVGHQTWLINVSILSNLPAYFDLEKSWPEI